MTEENKIKAQNMFAIAESYKQSAVFLPLMNEFLKTAANKQSVRMPSGKVLNFDCVHLSSVVLYGLASEIFLKALIVSNDQEYGHLHNLDELYSALPIEHQTKIQNKMPQNFQADFPNLLEKNKRTFIDWRYCYEKDALSCDLSFLQDFANAVAEVLLSEIK